MNTSMLRSKRVILPTLAAVAILGIGGGVFAATASDELEGSERDRVAAAAVDAVGGGTAVSVESGDDPGEAYEVEVRKDDGTEVDVALDLDLEVVGQEADDDHREGRDDDRGDSDDDDYRGDDSDDSRDDSDDRALSDTERDAAEQAALDAVGGGEVLKIEASDDGSEAYEVEVLDSDDTLWDVDLSADFEVLDKKVDD